MDLLAFLKETSYPGRGIVIGSDRAYYFIMGRSENSRNRVFVPTEDGIRTEAHDPAKLTDPSLIIYHPVRTMGDALVITNGDQTDTICRCGDFRRGLMTRSYEPDEPNWTPRISAGLWSCPFSSAVRAAACGNFSAMKAVTPVGASSSAPIRGTEARCLPLPGSRRRWSCRSRRRSGRR